MRSAPIFAFAGLLLCAFAPAPTFDIWGTGPERLAYNHLTGDCDTLVHAFGRNAAWGRWEMPRDQVSVIRQSVSGGAAKVVFRCADGSACIRAGKLDQTPDRLVGHEIPFATTEGADAYVGKLAELGTTCN